MRCVEQYPDIFSRDDVMERLGVGSKMVKSIKFWLLATGLCEEKIEKSAHRFYLTKDFGQIVNEYDKYFDDIATLFFIHYKLVSNDNYCIVWNLFFNEYSGENFLKEDMVNACKEFLNMKMQEGATYSDSLFEDDCASVIRMYCPAINKDDPEESLGCPLSELGLLQKSVERKNAFIKSSPAKGTLDALEISGLQHLLPSTYFDAAIEVIDKWEKDVPEAYEKFAQILKDEKTSVESVRIGLSRFEEEKYALFCEIYPSIAAGMRFNPLMNMDVVKLYSSVVDALASQTDYCGINIVFDEFSKFLESNLEKSQMYNLKIIQDLAEVASRSGKKQIHFTCITHKDILEYSSSDSFKTVEGRFSKIYFVASSEQNYELISNAIVKRDGYSNFVMEHKETFSEMINIASRANVFKELSEDSFEEKVVYGCFPLAPLTVYSLIKISELVGQNERTLFTFLANRGANTLGEFLDMNHDGVEFVTIDIIYNYFEELFKKEVFNVSIHSYWAKADAAIRQISDINQMRIIKAIAVINMMKDGMIKAIPSHIKAALLMDDISFSKASSELQRNHILSQRDSSEFVMLTANGVDVQKNISNLIASKALKVNVCNELNERWDWGYVIPHEHNDKKCIMRCFKKVFMDADVFCKYKNAQQILDEYPYDGVLIFVICAMEQETF